MGKDFRRFKYQWMSGLISLNSENYWKSYV